jgi:hypothetical protein
MKLDDLNNVRKLKVLKELLMLEKYNEITTTYNYLLDSNEYSASGSNLKYNIECLKSIFLNKNFGQCIEAVEKIIIALNARMFKMKCEQQWIDLINTEQKDVRFCDKCSRHVFEVNNEIDFNKRMHLQQCVFFNPEITPENADGICIVEAQESDLLGIPLFEKNEHESDNILPFKKEE